MNRRMVITIDGPAGTGKSTVAHRLARRLGLEFLDTGAMYRAAALLSLETKINPRDGAALADAVKSADMRFDWLSDPPRLHVEERDVTRPIRSQEVSDIVSIVASQPDLRRVLLDAQRRIADRHPRLVSEGRDQGSVVFPDAQVKFYLHAEASVRAKRRVMQLRSEGQPVDEAAVLRDIEQRDHLDSTRPDAPLVKPVGAIVVNTNDLGLDEVVDRMEAIVREQCPDAAFTAGCAGGSGR